MQLTSGLISYKGRLSTEHYKQKTMKPNLIKGITENASYNCHDNIALAVLEAIFQRTDSRNDLFRSVSYTHLTLPTKLEV